MSSTVSIIIPAGKEVDGLKESVESCRFQSYDDLQIIVTAASREVENLLYGLDDSRITVLATTIESQERRLAAAVGYAKGQAITFLMPGDSQEYNRIAEQSEFELSLCNIHYDEMPAIKQPATRHVSKENYRRDKDNLMTLCVATDLVLEVGMFETDSEQPIQDWLQLMFDTLNYRIPVLRSRLYRKG